MSPSARLSSTRLLTASSTFRRSRGTPRIANRQLKWVRDFAQVAFVGITTFTLVVAPGLPVKSVKELIALAKAKPRGNHAALPFADAPAFWRDLAERDGIAPRALAFAVLTAGRTSEVIGADWREMDLVNAVWTLGADRMKGGREHRVPLSKPALALLQTLGPKEGRQMPVSFYVDPALPKNVKTITLSYTFFEVGAKKGG